MVRLRRVVIRITSRVGEQVYSILRITVNVILHQKPIQSSRVVGKICRFWFSWF
jgi:hypothetical protein